jgi:hypothetical protein
MTTHETYKKRINMLSTDAHLTDESINRLLFQIGEKILRSAGLTGAEKTELMKTVHQVKRRIKA